MTEEMKITKVKKLKNLCPIFSNAQIKDYYYKNKLKIRKYRKEMSQKAKEYYHKEYYHEHKPKILQQAKEYYYKNKERILQKRKQKEENKESKTKRNCRQ